MKLQKALSDKEYKKIAIIGAGLSSCLLADELLDSGFHGQIDVFEVNKDFYEDRVWSFWYKKQDFKYEHLLAKSWDAQLVMSKSDKHVLDSDFYAYGSIFAVDFFAYIKTKYAENQKIDFKFSSPVDDLTHLFANYDLVFDSSSKSISAKPQQLWQVFYGVKIKTNQPCFDDSKAILMDFNSEHDHAVHFFYVLPFAENEALIESTYFTNTASIEQDVFEKDIKAYLQKHKIENYQIQYTEQASLPMFGFNLKPSDEKHFLIGTVGDFAKSSTGYSFMNALKQARFITKNLQNLTKIKARSNFHSLLDLIFTQHLLDYPEFAAETFMQFFKANSSDLLIRFLNDDSSLFEDLQVICSLPKISMLKSSLKAVLSA